MFGREDVSREKIRKIEFQRSDKEKYNIKGHEVNALVQLIPPYMGDEVKSDAERKIFEALKELDIKEGHVLHSLGLPRHRSKIYGEVDFVVVCDRGVACLEVKGGRVACREGRWFFTDRYGVEREKTEGPFAQVIGNMFSLRQVLKERFPNVPQMKNLLLASGVMFPDIEFHTDSQEWSMEMVYDRRTENITDYLNRIFDYWEERQHYPPSKLPPAVIAETVRFLRGEFSFLPSLDSRLENVERRLLRLTAEQVRVMDGLGSNDHLLIEGNAGTGKTFLAADFAQKKAEEGERVLCLAFNKNLSNHLSEQIGTRENLKVINLHALFGEILPIDIDAMQKDPNTYFSEVFPELILDHLQGMDEPCRAGWEYDRIVLDEGQDILRPAYLYVLDSLLKGGWEHGKWAVFYDEKQNIYNPEFYDGMSLLSSYSHAKFQLFINCRNTVQIGTFSARTSGIEMRDFIREQGEEVQKISYGSEEEYAKKIRDILKELKNEGVSMNDITFLAPRKYKNSSLAGFGIRVCEIGVDMEETNLPKFATIQGYKGMDSKIILLCDVEQIYPENFSSYMYIAATRARSLLYILATESFWEKRN